MRILFFGDIVGKLGRETVQASLPKLVQKYKIDFVIANAENASHGKGLTEKDYRDLRLMGIDCLTLGNHWNGKKQIDDYIDDVDCLVRPLNLLKYDRGLGSISFDVNGVEVRVTNLLGQAFMKEEVSHPIVKMRELLLDNERCIHIVDYHAESTSEKQIFAYYFDGEVSAVIGTHTHVQTADARILEKGTAFMCDVGMNGDEDGVIGFDKNSVIDRIVNGSSTPFQLNDDGQMMVNACVIEVDERTLKAINIIPINKKVGGKREQNDNLKLG